ncbi:MAG: enolase C-terminal domain-like protein [Saprospiraceae bacterium]|nr:hypothetical protein [Lewinella sp.]
MKILFLRYREMHIPLKVQFKQSNNSGANRSYSFILELETVDGVKGYGESCPRTYVTGESMEDVIRDLSVIQPGLIGREIPTYDSFKVELEHWYQQGIGPSIRCALELAWLDAWSRTENTPLPDLLGVRRIDSISYSLVLPLLQPEQLAGLLDRLKAFQPPALKLKVDRDQERNLANIRTLRAHYGDHFSIRVDVNGGWSLEEAERYIPQMMDLGVTSFEQPVAAEALSDMQTLTRLFGKEARIMADESLLDIKNANYFLQEKICNHFNLKISKLGGIRPALKIYRLAESYQVPCQLGAHFGETSLLTAAGALLATLVSGKLTACEGALGEFLLDGDVCSPSMQHDLKGNLDLSRYWQEPGLTPPVLPERLEAYSDY